MDEFSGLTGVLKEWASFGLVGMMAFTFIYDKLIAGPNRERQVIVLVLEMVRQERESTVKAVGELTKAIRDLGLKHDSLISDIVRRASHEPK